MQARICGNSIRRSISTSVTSVASIDIRRFRTGGYKLGGVNFSVRQALSNFSDSTAPKPLSKMASLSIDHLQKIGLMDPVDQYVGADGKPAASNANGNKQQNKKQQGDQQKGEGKNKQQGDQKQNAGNDKKQQNAGKQQKHQQNNGKQQQNKKQESQKADAAPKKEAAAPAPPATPIFDVEKAKNYPTDLLYFQDLGWTHICELPATGVKNMPDQNGEPKLSSAGAEITLFIPDAQGNKNTGHIVLNRTIFHPQGGGQSTDSGVIESLEGRNVGKVEMVKKDKDTGLVLHTVVFAEGSSGDWCKPGAKVNLKVAKEERILNSRLHSAGHLLDAGVKACGYEWQPGKGYHFHDGPYVEYIITGEEKELINKLTKEAVAKQLEVSCNKIVDDWSWEVVKGSDSEKEGSVGLRFNESNTRCVRFVDVDGPCGGTHVPKISEIGKLEISKIVLKKMNCRVSYKLRE